MKKINELEKKIKNLESKLAISTYDTRNFVQSKFSERSDSVIKQNETLNGMFTALVLESVDIWGMNRVRFYCPALHNPTNPIKSFPWAFPISTLGGFDDSGCSWVPPAGSTICIIFENGARDCAYYIGTTWHRNRGPDGSHNWGISIKEYQELWENNRKGYLCGKNDGSQVLPPWNTESYNAFDINSMEDFDSKPEARKKMSVPNIYGFKTNEKHAIKFVDGNPKCNHKGKRLEIFSSCGNFMIMKDDHLHDAVYTHPDCGGLGGSELECYEDGDFDSPSEAKPKEKTDCEGETSNSSILGGHPNTSEKKGQTGSNPYYKHKNECRPYKGPETPQNNKFALPQTGIQLLSISGQTIILDDSVEEPSGIPKWERSTKKFDFGCNDVFAGKLHLISATGHSIKLNDIESESKLRDEKNGIFIETACGNSIKMSDHTVPQKDCPGSPPNIGGKERGIKVESTARHIIHLCDEENEQSSPCRKDGGTPIAKSKKAFVLIRSGYGGEIKIDDANDQEKTDKQSIQIFSPQKDNKKRGPHIFRMQEKKEGKGMVFLRCGGDYFISVHDDSVEVVGDPEKNPGDKIEIISRKKLVYTKDNNISISGKSHYLISDENIYLLAGKDCDGEFGLGPCTGNVLVYVNGCIRLSDRVYAAASRDANPASIFMLDPLIECPK
jgi:hypothetical protein